MKRYRVTLSSNTIYTEIELASDMQQVKVGTRIDSDVRLHKELFFGDVELFFVKKEKTGLSAAPIIFISMLAIYENSCPKIYRTEMPLK